MTYFEQDYLDFFKELAANNHKDWFDQNRKRYETVVREPFKHFIASLIGKLAADDPSLDIDPAQAIFRINRDIRFSKDKTPYKLNNSAIISPSGRRNKNHPGMYIEFGPERMAFYGGIYMPSPTEVQKVRSYFMEHGEELDRILNSSDFKSNFGTLHGEKSKRIPKEFLGAAERQPVLWLKQWYYYKHLPPEIILSEDLMPSILDLYARSLPMKNFLSHAILD